MGYNKAMSLSEVEVFLQKRNEWLLQPQEVIAAKLNLILAENPLLKTVEEQLIPSVYLPQGVITMFNFERQSFPPAGPDLANWGGVVYLYPSPEALVAGKSSCARKIMFEATKKWQEKTAKVIQIGHSACGNIPIAVRSSLTSGSGFPELKGIFIGRQKDFPDLSHQPLIALRIVKGQTGPEWKVGVRRFWKDTSGPYEPYGDYSWQPPKKEEKGLFKLETGGETVSFSATPAFEAAPGFKFEIDQKYLPIFKD